MKQSSTQVLFFYHDITKLWVRIKIRGLFVTLTNSIRWTLPVDSPEYASTVTISSRERTRKIAPVEMQLHAVLFRWHVSQRDERQWRSHGWPKFACINVWAKWELAVLVERQWNGKLSENGDNRTSCWAKTAGQESRKLFGIPKDSVCRC